MSKDKPLKNSGVDVWVLHATTQWSRDHLEDDPKSVADSLLATLRGMLDAPWPELIQVQAHRWRYAHAVRHGVTDEFPKKMSTCDSSEPYGCLWDPQLSLGACGDWIPRLGDRPTSDDDYQRLGIERAILSGHALAGQFLRDWMKRFPVGNRLTQQKQAIQGTLFDRFGDWT